MNTIIFGIFTFIAGALLSGKIVAAWGGLKADIAALKVKAVIDMEAVHNRISAIESAIASKLP